MFLRSSKNLSTILVLLFIGMYSLYFSLFSINRYEKFYGHYFDLGIMHQTVYNSYKALQTGDFSRFLEMSNPHDTAEQVKRMSIHNDALLSLLAPFYFIHDGPETILVIQTLVLAFGALFVYLIARRVLKDLPYTDWIALVLAFAYLMYPPLQKANAFDFHAVTLATTFLLAMYYFWLSRQYLWSTIFILLSILTKEQLGLTIAMFGGFIILQDYLKSTKKWFSSQNFIEYIKGLPKEFSKNRDLQFSFFIIFIGVTWVLLSMKVIIPYFRGGEHFASDYFDHITSAPWNTPFYIFRWKTYDYLQDLLAPLTWLSIFAPIHFLIALPDLAINILSNNDNMRNTYFHYTSVITPFVFISAIYGVAFVFWFKKKMKDRSSDALQMMMLVIFILISTIYASYQSSTLPYAKHKDLYPWKGPVGRYEDVMIWKSKLDNDNLKVSATGRIAPHFTSRRYFYDFSWKYKHADFVVIETDDALKGYLREKTIPAYQMIQNDKKYIKIYDRNGIIVYEKLK